MERLISMFDGRRDGDLVICDARGVAYQKDMAKRIDYGNEYLGVSDSRGGTDIEAALNECRKNLVLRHWHGREFLDIGIGNGSFIEHFSAAKGFDVNPTACERLRHAGRDAAFIGSFNAITMWDVMEHIEDHAVYFKQIRKGTFLACSIPVFDDLSYVRGSKHYKPGEHLYYWTEHGFISWMGHHGFRLLEVNDDETKCGREQIKSFAFKRDLDDYRDMVGHYKTIHASKHYGKSAIAYLDVISEIVADVKPSSILDYGCGRSDLVAHFWLDGKRRIYRYDPAIPDLKRLPVNSVDLVLCCDVMEHVNMRDVDRVLRETRALSGTAIFAISNKPARAKLPDGRNAHVTIMTDTEWSRWIKSVFGRCTRIPFPMENSLVYRT